MDTHRVPKELLVCVQYLSVANELLEVTVSGEVIWSKELMNAVIWNVSGVKHHKIVSSGEEIFDKL